MKTHAFLPWLLGSFTLLFAGMTGCLASGDGVSGEASNTDANSITGCTGAAVVEGVDVSDGQGTIDWSAAKGAGIGFAVIKATQGTYNTQKTFTANWSNARGAGVIRGAYHFFDPTEDGAAQANHFLSVVGSLDAGDLPAMLDLECPDGDDKCLGWAGATGKAPPGLIYQRVLDFLHTVEKATGKKPVVYTFPAYFSSNGISTAELEAYPLWIAGPSKTQCFSVPSPWQKAVIWQHDWFGHIAGITGNVDRDRFLGSVAELQAFAAGGGGVKATHFDNSGHWLEGFGAADWAATGDFDGDGKDDIAWYEAWNNGSITVALSSGKSFTNAGKWLSGKGKPDFAAVGDFNGDGKADIAWYEYANKAGITVALSTGKGFTDAGQWVTGWGKPSWAGVGDFNGDGKADIAWYEAWNNKGVTLGLSSGSALNQSGQWVTGIEAPDFASVGDFNGDGKADIAWYNAALSNVTMLVSAGDKLTNGGQWLSGWGKADWAATGDFDGDGKADLAWYEAWNNHAITIGASSGKQLETKGAWVSGWGKADWSAVGDFDGDGHKDVAWYEAWNKNGITVGLAR